MSHQAASLRGNGAKMSFRGRNGGKNGAIENARTARCTRKERSARPSLSNAGVRHSRVPLSRSDSFK
ncbi:unnamed protein product, partial [Iphiclides podalirius]